MRSSVLIRKPAAKDFSRWIEMRALLWPTASVDEHSKEVAELQRDPSFIAFIAESSDKSLIGFCEASIRPFANGCKSMPVPFVEGCWVADEYRGRGIGEQLLTVLEKWAVGLGFTELCSDCDINNLASQEFHRGLGFQETERVVYFRKDLVGEIS